MTRKGLIMDSLYLFFPSRKKTMKEKIEKTKAHFRTNRKIYIALGAGFVMGAVAVLVVRKDNTLCRINTSRIMSPGDNNLVTVIEREGRGHPGYVVRCLETNEIFTSQGKAAECLGLRETMLSGHLNGKFPDVDGLHFERINVLS